MDVPLQLRAEAEIERRRRAKERLVKEQELASNKPDIVQWIQTEFFIPETGGPMPLHPYQKAVLTEAVRTNETGQFVYDFVLWSDIKKSAKSSIAAAVVLFRAIHTDYGSFKIVANNLKQADSRVFYYITRAIDLNPRLRGTCKVVQHRITLRNHSVIEAVPCNPSGEAGGNDDMVEYTELHAFKGTAAQKMWTETTLSPTKHGYSQRWADTYAGNSGESPILEPIYEQLVKDENKLQLSYTDKNGAVISIPAYAKGSIFCLWNTEPRLSWQTAEYYASEEAVLLPNEHRRIHKNEWTSSVNVFVEPEWWDACNEEGQKGLLQTLGATSIAELFSKRPQTPLVVSLDAGVSDDCFALVGVSRIKQKVEDIEYDITMQRLCRVWRPTKNQKVDFDEVYDYIVNDLIVNWRVVQISYDPHELHDMATRLIKKGRVWMYEFNQGDARLKADKQLRDTIRNGQIVHSSHPDLSIHVKNANAKQNAEDKTLRIIKRAQHLKIDGCVALSMANSECRRLLVA